MNPATAIAFLMCTVGNVCSAVGFKRLAQSVPLQADAATLWAAITSPWAWLGLFGGVLFLLSYLFVLRTIPISVAFPIIVSLSTGTIAVAGALLLGEPLGFRAILGLIAITGGVILVSG